MVETLDGAIENAVNDDPLKLARHLNMTTVGITLMARSGRSKQALRQLVDIPGVRYAAPAFCTSR